MAGASLVEIFNEALTHVGVQGLVASPTEDSIEARTCNAFWNIARRETLARADWPFARRIVELAQLSSPGLIEPWLYGYRIPADSLRVQYLMDQTGNETKMRRQNWELTGDADGLILLTQEEPPQRLRYLADVTTPGLYSPGFVEVVSLGLAIKCAPHLSTQIDIRALLTLRQLAMSEAMKGLAGEKGLDNNEHFSTWLDTRD